MQRWRDIEVYPAATRIAHGARDAGGSLAGLEGLLDCSAVTSEVATWADAADAAVCALAGCRLPARAGRLAEGSCDGAGRGLDLGRRRAGFAVIDLPTQGELEHSVDAFERDWGGVDELLYGLCRNSPGHRDRRLVAAKVALIGRAYSAGLERQVRPDPDGQAITRIADFMAEHALEVDAILARLSPITEPLDPEGHSMAAIVTQHGRLDEAAPGTA